MQFKRHNLPKLYDDEPPGKPSDPWMGRYSEHMRNESVRYAVIFVINSVTNSAG